MIEIARNHERVVDFEEETGSSDGGAAVEDARRLCATCGMVHIPGEACP
ncbi:MAG TPA: hypothetical protein VGG32_00720 [Thermoplasmata archaeon]|jgi:hypothetical protein